MHESQNKTCEEWKTMKRTHRDKKLTEENQRPNS